MKFVLLLVLVCPLNAAAQEAPAASEPSVVSTIVKDGTWDFGVFGAGGPGLGNRFDTRFGFLGVRAGRVITKDHGSGWKRGNLEWAVEVMPVYTVFTPARAVYGVSVMPVSWRWNFTRGRKIASYAALSGGLLFSKRNLPPGNTSWVNFTPQAALGANFLVTRHSAFLFEAACVHQSNANLGTYNPGYSAAMIFTVGYTWFKSRE